MGKNQVKEKKEKQVAVRFEVDLLKKIEKYAKREGRPIAGFIRHVMQQEIERREREESSLSVEEWDTLKGMLGRVLGGVEQKASPPLKAAFEEREVMEFIRLLRRFLH